MTRRSRDERDSHPCSHPDGISRSDGISRWHLQNAIILQMASPDGAHPTVAALVT